VLLTAVELARPALDSAGHALQTELPEPDIELNADATRLAQTFGNLLNNAAKYTPPGGQVRLRAWREDGQAFVEVQDNGIGIAPDMLENVFNLFTQVAPGTGQLASGLGIGLYLVRNLVELHGGTVAARSDGIGRGSVFRVTLPCLPAVQAAAAPVDAQGAPGPATELRVLVVDDNQDAADTLAAFLELLGVQVRTVHSGPEVVPAADAFAPDVVLLDIGLPGMDGYEVARALRAHPRLAQVQLIALTGWGSEQDRRRALDAGFDRHLTKPVDLGKLEELLREVPLARGA
jgi:CheY-like chemotaxis protein